MSIGAARVRMRHRIDMAVLDVPTKAGFDPNQLRDPHTGEWIDDAVIDQLAQYVTGIGVRLSEALRGKREMTDGMRERIESLTQLIDREGETAPTLYRAVDETNLSAEQLGLLKPGKTFFERGFSSTSSSESFVAEWAEGMTDEPMVFHIQGARGLPVSKFVDPVELVGQDQSEWLLRPGTEYRVIKVERNRSGVRIVTVEAT